MLADDVSVNVLHRTKDSVLFVSVFIIIIIIIIIIEGSPVTLCQH